MECVKFKPYNPAWLVELVKQQRPDLPWLADAVGVSVQAHEKRRGRKKKCIAAYFVDPKDANQPGAEWQYAQTISLDHPEFGHIKLEILAGQRVGGIEFYDRLFSSGKPKSK